MAKFELSYLREVLQVLKNASINMDTRFKHATRLIDDSDMDRDDTFIAVTSLTGGLAITLKSLDGVIQGLSNLISMIEKEE